MHLIIAASLVNQGQAELYLSVERNMQYLERGTKRPFDSDSVLTMTLCTSCRTKIDSCQMVIQIYDTLAENVIKANCSLSREAIS